MQEQVDPKLLVEAFKRTNDWHSLQESLKLAKQFIGNEMALEQLIQEGRWWHFFELVRLFVLTEDKESLDSLFNYFIRNKERVMPNRRSYFILDMLLPCWYNALVVDDQTLFRKYEKYWDENVDELEEASFSSFINAGISPQYLPVTNRILKMLIDKYKSFFQNELNQHTQIDKELLASLIEAKQLDILYLKYLSAYQCLKEQDIAQLNEVFKDKLVGILSKQHGKEDIKAINAGLMQIYKSVINKSNPNIVEIQHFCYFMSAPQVIASYSKMGDLTLQGLTLSQANIISVKKLKKLFSLFDEVRILNQEDKQRLVQAYIVFGPQRCHELFTNQYGEVSIEHLGIFKQILTKDYQLDNQTGEPKHNDVQQKLMDFLFASGVKAQDTNIKRLLEGPTQTQTMIRLFNNWELVCESLSVAKNGITYNNVMAMLEDLTLALAPYQKQVESPLQLNKNEQGVINMLDAYQKMQKRTDSVIPKVSGQLDENFSYEILDLKDINQFNVGQWTNSCFQFGSAAESSLIHACTERNSRIFTVSKNDKVIAQSWLWRDGTTLCFDNIEIVGTSRKDKEQVLEAYKQGSKELIKVSVGNEAPHQAISLVTLGNGGGDIVPDDAEELKINMQPSPGFGLYTDAKRQVKLVQAETFTEEAMKYGTPFVSYQDPRIEPWPSNLEDEKEIKQAQLAMDKIIGFSAIASGKEPPKDEVDLSKYNAVMIGEDWFIAVTKENDLYTELLPYDQRASDELAQYLNVANDILLTAEEESIINNRKDLGR